MDTTHPQPLCTVSCDWRMVSTLEMIEIFDSTFSAKASVLPNEDVATAAREYSEYLRVPVPPQGWGG